MRTRNKRFWSDEDKIQKQINWLMNRFRTGKTDFDYNEITAAIRLLEHVKPEPETR